MGGSLNKIKSIGITDFRDSMPSHFDGLENAGNEILEITKGGKPVAYVVSQGIAEAVDLASKYVKNAVIIEPFNSSQVSCPHYCKRHLSLGYSVQERRTTFGRELIVIIPCPIHGNGVSRKDS